MLVDMGGGGDTVGTGVVGASAEFVTEARRQHAIDIRLFPSNSIMTAGAAQGGVRMQRPRRVAAAAKEDGQL